MDQMRAIREWGGRFIRARPSWASTRDLPRDGIGRPVVVELEPSEDVRGSFAPTFDAAEWERRGLSAEVAQSSISTNSRRGTLRGLHFQREPDAQAKLVRCSRGAVFDVGVDIGPTPQRTGNGSGPSSAPTMDECCMSPRVSRTAF